MSPKKAEPHDKSRITFVVGAALKKRFIGAVEKYGKSNQSAVARLMIERFCREVEKELSK